jgi:hypothetical protein
MSGLAVALLRLRVIKLVLFYHSRAKNSLFSNSFAITDQLRLNMHVTMIAPLYGSDISETAQDRCCVHQSRPL